MSKKRKFKKPQIRRRSKRTTGQLQFTNVVYMERERVDDPENPGRKKTVAYAVCTCDKWRSSEAATTITKVGMEAKKHIEASDGKCAFRYHDIPDDLNDEQLTAGAVTEARRKMVAEELAKETSTEVDPTTQE